MHAAAAAEGFHPSTPPSCWQPCAGSLEGELPLPLLIPLSCLRPPLPDRHLTTVVPDTFNESIDQGLTRASTTARALWSGEAPVGDKKGERSAPSSEPARPYSHEGGVKGVRQEESGELERMKESYEKGVANHLGPELCVVCRKAGGEALAGAHAGQPLSPESTQLWGADAVPLRGRQHSVSRQRKRDGDPTGSKTLSMHGTSSGATWEIPGFSRRPLRCRGAGAQREG